MVGTSIVAHRGASAHRAEHTLAAYELALEQGADGLECDIRLTKDGHLVCVHDRTVDRTTSSRGVVGALTLEELSEFDYGSWHESGEPAGLLTLDMLLELIKGTKAKLFVETKHPVRFGGLVESKLVDALKNHGLADAEQIIMMSFSSRAVRRFRELAPKVPTVLLLDRLWTGRKDGSLPPYADYTGPGVHLLHQDPGYVERCRDRGHDTYVWTVDEPQDVMLCRDLGVRYLATNAPANTRRLLTDNLAPESASARRHGGQADGREERTEDG